MEAMRCDAMPISIRGKTACTSLRLASSALDATYKIPEKQKMLPMPKRTLKMIGTETLQSMSNQREVPNGKKMAILPPPCSDHQHLTRAIVPIQCTLQARKQKHSWSATAHKKGSRRLPPIRSFSTQEQGDAKSAACNAVRG